MDPPINYRLLIEARAELKRIAEHYYHGDGRANSLHRGVAYQACQSAQHSVFEAMNTVSSHGGDEEMGRVIHFTEWPEDEPDAA